MPRLSEIDTSKVFETLKRVSPIKPVEFLIGLGDGENAGGISIHFEGNGWKLSGIRLASAAVQLLAQSLVTSKGRNG
jgi:hypothetical protein